MPLALVACVALVLAATSGALAGPVSAADGPRASAAQGTGSKPSQRRVFLLGLRQRGTPAHFASRVSDRSSPKKPSSAIGQSAAGGAAQPGYDLATGLGSLNAQAFAAAVDSLP